MQQRLLFLVVFWSGMVTLGTELTASRLLAPAFGTSTIIWAVLIGMVLTYLALGYWLGGRWADRAPFPTTLYTITASSAFLIGLVPLLAAPVLQVADQGFRELNGGLLAGSLVTVLILLSVPLTLLGCVSPFALKLALRQLDHAGAVAGQLYAMSTLGSVVGAFLPVLWLIPSYGHRATFFWMSLSLMGLSLVGLVLNGAMRRAMITALLGGGMLLMAVFSSQSPIKPTEGMLWEGDSPYHYIRVVEEPSGWRRLELNEGQGVHSLYKPGEQLTGSIWDFFTLVPYFNPAPYDPFARPHRWAVIGVAAGSTPRSIQAIYGDHPVDGVEIDPDIVQAAYTYFDLGGLPNLTVTVADGRRWLAHTPQAYDVIAIDAYRQPYIPFHLTTVEFFQQTLDHLTPDGVVAINVGRAPYDWRLVDALAATMRQVFPTVYVLDVDDSYNSLVIASRRPSTLAQVRANLQSITEPRLAQLGHRIQDRIREAPAEGLIFTDDHAPVEQVVDLMIINFAMHGGAEALENSLDGD